MTNKTCPNCKSENPDFGYGSAAGTLGGYNICLDCRKYFDVEPEFEQWYCHDCEKDRPVTYNHEDLQVTQDQEDRNKFNVAMKYVRRCFSCRGTKLGISIAMTITPEGIENASSTALEHGLEPVKVVFCLSCHGPLDETGGTTSRVKGLCPKCLSQLQS